MTGRTRPAGTDTDRLARRYRRLLVTYPRSYRRDRGAELLGALLDAAPPGRTRPTVREALDLLRHGLRARLGRPASRSVVGWALLAATIGGLFGAAFATRAAWETAPSPPGPAEAVATTAEILPGLRFTGFVTPPATFTMYGQPLSRDLVPGLLLVDGGEYTLAETRGELVGGPVPSVPELAGLARRNLVAHGWTVHPTTTTSATVVVAARRGDTAFRLEMYTDPSVRPGVSVAFQPVTPVAVYPAGAAGGLAGAFAAFLVFGWASRRTLGGWTDAVGRVMLGLTMLLWWGPTVLGVTSMARHHADESHPSWHPMWEWLGQPALSGVFLLGCVSALTGLLAAAVGGRDGVAVRSVR
jgi:hypothetical protein